MDESPKPYAREASGADAKGSERSIESKIEAENMTMTREKLVLAMNFASQNDAELRFRFPLSLMASLLEIFCTMFKGITVVGWVGNQNAREDYRFLGEREGQRSFASFSQKN